jgi:hypothetical protein
MEPLNLMHLFRRLYHQSLQLTTVGSTQARTHKTFNGQTVF